MESADFGAESFSLGDSTEENWSLYQNLKILGIGVEVETNFFSENNGLFMKPSFQEFTIKKNHNLIAYRVFYLTSNTKDLRLYFERVRDNM